MRMRMASGFVLFLFMLLPSAWGARAHTEHVGIDLVVEVGDQAPGMAAGVTFASLGFPPINENGEVAFSATVTGPGSASTTARSGPAHRRPRVRRPGGRHGAGHGDDLQLLLRSHDRWPHPDLDGEVAFDAGLLDRTDGIYVYDLDTDTLLSTRPATSMSQARSPTTRAVASRRSQRELWHSRAWSHSPLRNLPASPMTPSVLDSSWPSKRTRSGAPREACVR